jgi:hypothetical protein
MAMRRHESSGQKRLGLGSAALAPHGHEARRDEGRKAQYEHDSQLASGQSPPKARRHGRKA